MLINISNHPHGIWKEEQIEAAMRFGEIVDIPFPNVDPFATEIDIAHKADDIVNEIITAYGCENVFAHVMGEFTMTFALIKCLEKESIPCYASTSERVVRDIGDGKKEVEFKFVQFRKYGR